MTPLFRKLNHSVQREIVVLNAPPTFDVELAALGGVAVRRSVGGCATIEFAVAFVQTLEEVRVAASAILPRAIGDAIVWFAYPKQTLKRFRCEFNRDTGWAAVCDAGFDSVRQVAVDDDWTALRFRRVAFIGR